MLPSHISSSQTQFLSDLSSAGSATSTQITVTRPIVGVIAALQIATVQNLTLICFLNHLTTLGGAQNSNYFHFDATIAIH